MVVTAPQTSQVATLASPLPADASTHVGQAAARNPCTAAEDDP